jgi:diguanylate cyclase (GGDEF)-like protein
VAERIRNKINQLNFIFKGERIPISASLGIAGKVMSGDDDCNTLIDAADKALYEAKHKGRNCSVEASIAS